MAQETENMQNDDLGQKLNAMLSDPESLSRLAGMASALASSGVLSGLIGGSGGQREDGDSAAEGDGEPQLPAAVTGGGGQGEASGNRLIHAASSRHSTLLRALKPYLGQEKQARIDQMMRLLQLAELADTVLRGK